MSKTVSDDLRIVLLAAMAWLHEHDFEGHTELIDAAIDKNRLVEAIERLTEETHD